MCLRVSIYSYTSTRMLVWGISNPEGVHLDSSIYLTKSDIQEMIAQIEQANRKGDYIPVKIEHKGIDLGRVVSAWEHNGQLECLLDLNENVLEGSLGSEFVRQGITKDLSLGYEVSLQHSDKTRFSVKQKKLKEISIVKKGARNNCHILGVCSNASQKTG
jgi:hypothetical protein